MADKKNKDKREFGTCEKVVAVIKPMEDIERYRAEDRAKINNLFNGKRPYTKEEEEKNQIPVNVNWGMGKKVMRDANNQINSALLHPGILFNCALEKGQIDKRTEWSAKFTDNIHIPIQRGKSGKKHSWLMKNRNASVCMHGIGAMMWINQQKWMPRFVGLEDLLIPTETYCDFSNMRYFAVNMYLTTGELIDMTFGDYAKPGWNKEMVDGILKSMKNLTSEGVPPTWRDQPEAMANIWKENRGWYYSDATPKVRCRWFFYQEIDNPKKWYRVLILREAYGDVKPSTGFLFDGSDEPFADDIDEILQVQYGDNNFVAPLKYHVVRGLGVDLYAPIEELNRLFCEFIWAVHIDFRILFKIKDPADRDRLKQIVLSQFGTIPEGMEMLKRDERYQVSPDLFNEAVGVMRDTMQESSSSFVKDTNDGTEKEMTAKEATIRLNQANTMVSSMLQSLYLQEGFYYEQVVKRFCYEKSTDPQVKTFQEKCILDGIPKEFVTDPKVWRVTPERVLGGGDKTQGQQEAAWLWANRVQFDPSVQPKIMRVVVGTLLNNFDKAMEFVPLAKVDSTDGTQAAENVFGTLMTGNQCGLRKGIDQEGYITTLLKMMTQVVTRILSTDGTGTMDEITGLATVSQNVSQHIMILAQDKQRKSLVKQYGDALGQILNQVKAIGQRLMEKHQSQMQAQSDPAGAAKVQTAQAMAQVKMQIAQANAALKMKQKQLDFALAQQQKSLQLAAELKHEELRTHADMSNQAAQHIVDLLSELRMANAKALMMEHAPKNNSEKS
jgi:hypothetical protein